MVGYWRAAGFWSKAKRIYRRTADVNRISKDFLSDEKKKTPNEKNNKTHKFAKIQKIIQKKNKRKKNE